VTDLSDPFTRADAGSPGGSWTQVIALAQLSSNAILYTDPSAMYVHGTSLAGVSQYQKASYGGLTDANVNRPYFVFRYNDSSSPFYTVRFISDSNTVEWRSHTSSADTAGTLIDSAALTIGATATFGVTLDDTGNNTIVRVWNSPTGLPVSASNWDGDTSPDLTFTANPGAADDSGLVVGWGGTSDNVFTMTMDDWFGGDTPSGIVLPTLGRVLDIALAADWKPQAWHFPLATDLALDDFPEGGAPSGAISGATTITFSATGVLTGTGALSGAATLTFSPSGTIQGFAPITGATTLTFSPSATLTGAGALVGATMLTFSPSATLTGAGALVGSTTLTFAPSATLTGTGALTGTATITFSPSGTLTDASGGSGDMTGSSSITFTAVGVITGTGDLAGSTTLTFSASGALSDASAPAPEPTTQTGAGSSGHRPKQRQRLYVEIDGQQFLVDSANEARQLLEHARALAERQADAKADKAVKVLRRKDAVPVVQIAAPVIDVSRALAPDLAPLIADIERLYKRAAETAELRLLLARQLADEDDDDDVLLLI